MERGIFFGCLLVGISLFRPSLALAITWEFDEEGNVQGWTSFEGASSDNLGSTLPRLQSQVWDGVWRIKLASFKVGQVPAVELISPRIGYDSALFDQVIIYFRVVHARPLVGGVQLSWVNTANQDVRNGSDLGFQFWTPEQIFTTDWQEFAVGDLRSMPVVQADGFAFDLCWEGELIDIRLQMVFSSEPISDPERWPEAVEIDRIVLTGVEEQLQGELPPPAVEETATANGLFDPPEFSFLDQAELGGGDFPFSTATSGALGDLDGDGDLDLVLPWGQDDSVGWLAALNDGVGHFAKSYVERVRFPWVPYLNGADINHDGRMDLLLVRWGDAQYLAKIRRNDPLEGWIDGPTFTDVLGLGLADADGDRYADLWLVSGFSMGDLTSSDLESREFKLVLYRNDPSGHFQVPLIFSIDTDETKYFPWRWVHHLRGGKSGILWTVREGKGYAITSLNEKGEMEPEPLLADIGWEFVLYAGDVDQDGDVDLLASESQLDPPYERGLNLWCNQGDDSLVKEEWLPEVILDKGLQPEPVQFFDLNQDGILDLVMVDHDERQPALVVGLGRPDGPPEVEMYYFEGKGGTLLGGDLDEDGDTDLVMVRRDSGSEGVYVFKNRRVEQRTAVMAEAEAIPSLFQLAQNYPNPFNPQTWIPFEIPAESGPVDLRIYNVLGQPIRRLVEGRLTAGHHLMPWDGRDSQGQAVSAGMYLYRLQTGDRQITRKMLKIE